MMSRNYSFVEPHPTVPKSGGFVYGGRGGAGNYKRYKPEEITSGPTATGPASRVSLTKTFKRQSSQPTGRGGAGNMFRPDSEERVFQFDEEMMRTREAQAPVYHIGRGGAANWVDESRRQPPPPRTERLNSTTSAMSSSSEDSTNGNAKRIDGAFSKLARRFS